ncbi:hypothetical protein FNV43_RR17766 [Rhamnella rubrinervis]|uniref:Uncharacterized protein n=1 Tax=Rhamnella rubrinervis TaxID=2594499 RepID=A0A8K0E3U0_9ROSA|nr:hypothetical protein FNV43_RR17766 [Rhamnella rubrinervis]
MHHVSGQGVDTNKSVQFEGRLEAFTPERDNPYGNVEGQWRWERDGSKLPNSNASHMLNKCQDGDTTRSYFQGQRTDPKLALEKQSNNDTRSQSLNEDMDIGYEDNPISQTFEGLEQKFYDDILKLAKEQNNAEDAENARHREKINAINIQYEEQLAALRARHASRRDDFLRRESNARQHRYQEAIVDHYPNSSIGPNDPRGYRGIVASPSVPDTQRGYDTEQYDSYRERARFLGASRDHGFEPRGTYPGGRVYDTGSRYY